VFRDTAVEVEEKNLREIAEARQRLVMPSRAFRKASRLRRETAGDVEQPVRELYPVTDDLDPACRSPLSPEAAERGLIGEARDASTMGRPASGPHRNPAARQRGPGPLDPDQRAQDCGWQHCCPLYGHQSQAAETELSKLVEGA
jgi:hypothetical protein